MITLDRGFWVPAEDISAVIEINLDPAIPIPSGPAQGALIHPKRSYIKRLLAAQDENMIKSAGRRRANTLVLFRHGRFSVLCWKHASKILKEIKEENITNALYAK